MPTRARGPLGPLPPASVSCLKARFLNPKEALPNGLPFWLYFVMTAHLSPEDPAAVVVVDSENLTVSQGLESCGSDVGLAARAPGWSGDEAGAAAPSRLWGLTVGNPDGRPLLPCRAGTMMSILKSQELMKVKWSA